MMPSMSRPANLYDNASCESFIKTLKREEIYANEYRDLDHLRANIEEFMERYYNRCRLHSALGYRPPEEFEQAARTEVISAGATMSFFRHEEIHRSDGSVPIDGKPTEAGFPDHRLDESPAGYSSAGCSPAEPASFVDQKKLFEKGKSLNGKCSNDKLSQRRGSPQETVDDFVAVESLQAQQFSANLNTFAATY